jgi:hypothetical protein
MRRSVETTENRPARISANRALSSNIEINSSVCDADGFELDDEGPGGIVEDVFLRLEFA